MYPFRAEHKRQADGLSMLVVKKRAQAHGQKVGARAKAQAVGGYAPRGANNNNRYDYGSAAEA